MADRIPLEDFTHYPTARLASGASIRWQAAMEAFEQARKERLAAGDFQMMPPEQQMSLRGRYPGWKE